MKYLFVIAGCFLTFSFVSCQVRISGIISGYESERIVLQISTDGFASGKHFKRIKVKTDDKGRFAIDIPDFYNISTYNGIKIRRKWFNFYLEPGDSLYIIADKNNLDNIKFDTKYPSRSYFCNDYYEKLQERRKIAISQYPLDTIKRLNKIIELEYKLLNDYLTNNNLDTIFYAYMSEYTKYSKFNLIGGKLKSDYYQTIEDEIEFDNELLKYNLIYYSVLNQHLASKNVIVLDFYSIDGIKNGFKIAEKYFNNGFIDGCKAYYLWVAYNSWSNSKLLNSPGFKTIVEQFISECSDQITKKEISLLKDKFESKN